ncbi:MAG TPA: histidinol-phosphate transaminase [Candidatus Saccharimonadales bacterium]|nr:histidinol-phosphate transaminase [Candidatus Saccharimonadales bacterium]
MGAFEQLIRPGVRAIQPYTPGKPIEEVERELGVQGALKFASNENPAGPSPLVLQAIRDHAAALNRYGDAGCYYVRQELARFWELPDDWFVVCNGSSESIYLSAVLTCTVGDEVVFSDPPSFLLYRSSALAVGATPVAVPRRALTHDLDAMRAAITPKTRLVYVCNPDNPTGTSVGRAEYERFLDGLREDILVVFDHAYAEYATRPDYPDILPYIRAGRPVVELRTFSKAYSLAGMRVSYLIAPPALVGYYNRARLPFNVSSLAQAAAVAALRDQDHVRRAARLNQESLARIIACMQSLGLETVPTQANFVLVRLPADARRAEQELLRRGIIVRNMVAFGLPPEYLRITSGTLEETERLVKVCREVLSGAVAR